MPPAPCAPCAGKPWPKTAGRSANFTNPSKPPANNKLRDAQAALDTAVRAAYGMKPAEDILAFLLKLNLELAEKEAQRPAHHPARPARLRGAAKRIHQPRLRQH